MEDIEATATRLATHLGNSGASGAAQIPTKQSPSAGAPRAAQYCEGLIEEEEGLIEEKLRKENFSAGESFVIFFDPLSGLWGEIYREKHLPQTKTPLYPQHEPGAEHLTNPRETTSTEQTMPTKTKLTDTGEDNIYKQDSTNEGE
jgi:hypothetical protein